MELEWRLCRLLVKSLEFSFDMAIIISVSNLENEKKRENKVKHTLTHTHIQTDTRIYTQRDKARQRRSELLNEWIKRNWLQW